MNYYKVSETELKHLILNSEILNRLQNGGVDNWDWYCESLNEDGDLEDWEENELIKFLNGYEKL